MDTPTAPSPSPTRHGVFDRLIARCRGAGAIPVAVAAPTTDVALVGAIDAAREGLIDPILVAPHDAVRGLAERLGVDLGSRRVVDASDDADAAAKAVQLCRSGEALALMKGSLHTDTLMHAVLHHDSGLKTARRMSHVFLLDAPAYPRPLAGVALGAKVPVVLTSRADSARARLASCAVAAAYAARSVPHR